MGGILSLITLTGHSDWIPLSGQTALIMHMGCVSENHHMYWKHAIQKMLNTEHGGEGVKNKNKTQQKWWG
jgi:hypothetical protein